MGAILLVKFISKNALITSNTQNEFYFFASKSETHINTDLVGILKVVSASANNVYFNSGYNSVEITPDNVPAGYSPLGIIGAAVYLSGASRTIQGFKFENGKIVIACEMSTSGHGSASGQVLYIRTGLLS